MKNIFGEPLKSCCQSPITGYYRDGYCRSDQSDLGRHVVCAIVTKEFLNFSKERGNDLSTPQKQYLFPGLKEGDRWCLCVLRWKEAFDAGYAPMVDLEATNEITLKYVKIEDLIKHSYKSK
tara:strand:+ start:386 stop:748 length:363 start_codon:yes stop_codon:yes gene_type:complete